MSQNVIELKNVRKEFVSTKHYPGFKGAVKGLFTKETETKVLERKRCGKQKFF